MAEGITYMANGTDTALALLKQNAEVETKSFEFGEYVVAIDGTPASNDRAWILRIDGEAAVVGADAITPAKGQEVEWSYEPIEPAYA